MTATRPSTAPSSPAARPELDDITLARARQGDEAACRALVVMYERRIFAVLSRMLGPRGLHALVEDLAQETFLRVFRELPGYRIRSGSGLSSWVLTIATRLAIDALRRRRATRSLDSEPIQLSAGCRTDAPLERRALGEAIARAVGRLPEDHRAVFVLREYHDLTYEEIAQALDCELGTVKSRLARARQALRRSLARVRQRG